MYDGASDDLKLNGVYEFIGVLSRAPELAIAHMEAGEGCSCGSASDSGNVMHLPGCSATQELMEDEALGRLPTSLVSKTLGMITGIFCTLQLYICTPSLINSLSCHLRVVARHRCPL